MKKKIYYHDTDSGGVVYYANYLKFFEEARTEFLARRGILITDLIKEGRFFVVSRQEVDYKAPVVYGEEIEVRAEIIASSGVRINFAQQAIKPDGRIAVEAKTTLVYVDNNFKPAIMPKELRDKINSHA